VGSSSCVSIPDAARLVDAVLERSTGKDSSIHGESHWQRVAAAGLTLLPETPGADPALVFLFALFHDSMRLNDNYDPLHGPRARMKRMPSRRRRKPAGIGHTKSMLVRP
jgi:hypothetical protein